MTRWRQFIGWVLLGTMGAGTLAWSFYTRFRFERRLAQEIELAQREAAWIKTQEILFSSHAVPAGLPFRAFLARLGIDRATTAQVVSSAQPVFDLRRLRAGNELAIGRSVLGELRAVRYQIDPGRILWIARQAGGFHAEIRALPSTVEDAGVAGEICDSLFDAVKRSGESPELAMRLADIFGWDLDFYTDPRPGDTFRVVVEKRKLANGETLGYGRILAAEYDNDGRFYRAVLFHDPAGHPAYYTPDGKSLKKAFLHSPLKYSAHITSHFSFHRFHRILKAYRPHLGTDYAAPMGTPVQTIGDGRVVFAGRKGEGGNLVEIQHTNGYETYYMHLSRIFVRRGEGVAQGQRIGLVGMTGLATGPHLDFRIERHGRFLNFERLLLPPANPVLRRDWSEFAAVRDREVSLLPDLHEVLARAAGPTQPNSSGSSASPSVPSIAR